MLESNWIRTTQAVSLCRRMASTELLESPPEKYWGTTDATLVGTVSVRSLHNSPNRTHNVVSTYSWSLDK